MPETIAQSSSENYNKSVGTSAVVLAKGGGLRHSGSGVITVGGTINMPRYITVHNNHVSQTLYLGWGSDVSTSNGLPVPAGEYRTLRVWYDDELWAIASGAATDARVYVLHGKGNPTFDVLDLSPTAWFDASDESTITDTGGAVDTWADKSGNGYDLTQGTGSAQPVTGSRTVNGKNVLDFIRGDYLDGGDILDLGTNAFTAFIVVKWDDTALAAPWGKHIAGSTDGRYGLYRTATTLTSLYDPDGGNTGTVDYADTDTSTRIVSSVLDRNGASSTHDLRIDGAVVATKNFTDPGSDWDTTGPWRIGRYGTSTSFDFDGVVGEFILLLRTATAQEIADTETYLADKWGITLS